MKFDSITYPNKKRLSWTFETASFQSGAQDWIRTGTASKV